MKVLSLFSGCGGLDLGMEGSFTCLKKSINQKIHPNWIQKDQGDFVQLQPTKFQNVFACDIKPSAQRVWNHHWQKDSEQIFHLESVVDLVNKAKQGEFQFPKDIDIVTGGFPCQDFSLAGKRLGFQSMKNHHGKAMTENDVSRGELYFWMKEVVAIVKPKMFIAENVKGLAIWEPVRQKIYDTFSEAGYLVVPTQVLEAHKFGVPQTRSRIFFLGFRRDALTPEALNELRKKQISETYDPYPQQTHGENLMPYVTCQDAFINLFEPEQSSDINQQQYSKAKYLAKGQGNKEVDLNKPSMTIRSEHHGNIEFRRLSAEHGGEHQNELAKNLPERRLTIRECARLQTFPDDFSFILPKEQNQIAVSASEAYKIIGNAVPCLLGYHIAKNLESKWDLYFVKNR